MWNGVAQTQETLFDMISAFSFQRIVMSSFCILTHFGKHPNYPSEDVQKRAFSSQNRPVTVTAANEFVYCNSYSITDANDISW